MLNAVQYHIGNIKSLTITDDNIKVTFVEI